MRPVPLAVVKSPLLNFIPLIQSVSKSDAFSIYRSNILRAFYLEMIGTEGPRLSQTGIYLKKLTTPGRHLSVLQKLSIIKTGTPGIITLTNVKLQRQQVLQRKGTENIP